MEKKWFITLMVLLAGLAMCFFVGCGGGSEEMATEDVEAMPDLLAEDELAADTDFGGEGETTLDDLEMAEEPLVEEPAAATPTFSGELLDDGRYVVQISASRLEGASNQLAQKLKDQGIPGYVAIVENPTPDLLGTFYRVRIGYFNRVTDARSYGETVMAAMGYNWWADNKSNDNVGYSEAAGAAEEIYEAIPAAEEPPAFGAEEATGWETTEPATEAPADDWGTGAPDAGTAAPEGGAATDAGAAAPEGGAATDAGTAAPEGDATDDWGAGSAGGDDWGSEGGDDW